MKVGDIIPLTIDENIQACVNGVPAINARYGIRNGQYALKIDSFVAQEEN
jgi:flagellar motor switch protein FliM